VAKISMFDVAFLDKAAYWMNLAYIASVCLILATSVIVVYISHQRATLRGLNLERVQKQSAERLAAANQQSAEANQRAAALTKEVADAQAKAAAAALAEARLQKENLQLSMDLERERSLRLEIQKRTTAQPPSAQQPLSPPAAADRSAAGTRESKTPLPPGQMRVLTAQQEEVLSGELRRFAEKSVTIIELGDPEPGSLARQLATILKGARWQVFVNHVGALVPPQYGVICTHTSGDDAASAFAKALRSAHLVVYERTNTVDQFQIIVGLKPPQ
jgi:hypothetical protein